MSNDYVSFISEHTAEYVVVPKLTRILLNEFEVVIPIFPWISREMNSQSQKIHGNEKFMILGLFVKRSKINIGQEGHLITINENFFTAASAAKRHNIPFILGSPLVESWFELNDKAKCFWAKLNSETDKLFLVKPKSENKFLKGAFNSGNEIIEFVLTEAKEISFDEALTAIRDIKQNNRERYMFGVYRPVYFLIQSIRNTDRK